MARVARVRIENGISMAFCATGGRAVARVCAPASVAAYVNFLGSEGDSGVRAARGAHPPTAAGVKRRYDPAERVPP